LPNQSAANRLAEGDRPGSAPVKAQADEVALALATDRRSHERYVTVFRLAKLIGAREEFCLIRNVSAGGLKAETFTNKAVGDRVAVDFGDETPRSARVAWVANDNIGLTFDEAIDVARALSKAPRAGRTRARPIRLLVELDAGLATEASRAGCQLIDISQGGAKVRTALMLRAGDKVTLDLAGLGKIPGVIRWAKQGNAGVAFPGQLAYRRLAAWVGDLARADRSNGIAG
jgi:hypothetical protein